MKIYGSIKSVKYAPQMCPRLLPTFDKIGTKAFKHSVFLFEKDKTQYAISWWVSPKRTRSYPYARIYDTMLYPNRVTIIPIVKDEGIDGDRDYLQWDSVSFVSLLGVYVIIAYYSEADISSKYDNKIILLEKKHSKLSLAPSLSDIKDAFLKLILYRNLSNIVNGKKKFYSVPALGLTSEKFNGFADNYHRPNIKLPRNIVKAFEEGKANNILVFLWIQDTRNIKNKFFNPIWKLYNDSSHYRNNAQQRL